MKRHDALDRHPRWSHSCGGGSHRSMAQIPKRRHPQGMALCRLRHWGFDKGMLGVSDSSTVITLRTIGIELNYPGLLTSLSGRGIIPPAEHSHWPGREYLSEHRREWRL